MAVLPGAAVSLHAVVVVPASHQVMIVMDVMHLLTPTTGMYLYVASSLNYFVQYFIPCYSIACFEA
jgi:hypothetical protein